MESQSTGLDEAVGAVPSPVYRTTPVSSTKNCRYPVRPGTAGMAVQV